MPLINDLLPEADAEAYQQWCAFGRQLFTTPDPKWQPPFDLLPVVAAFARGNERTAQYMLACYDQMLVALVERGVRGELAGVALCDNSEVAITRTLWLRVRAGLKGRAGVGRVQECVAAGQDRLVVLDDRGNQSAVYEGVVLALAGREAGSAGAATTPSMPTDPVATKIPEPDSDDNADSDEDDPVIRKMLAFRRALGKMKEPEALARTKDHFGDQWKRRRWRIVQNKTPRELKYGRGGK